MNLDETSALDLVKALLDGTQAVDGVERVLFPPFPFIKAVSELLSAERHFLTGGQDCSAHAQGAYTGEVSAHMLRSVGCRYVLVGHSERRRYFNETAEQLRQKIDRALENNLSVVYCVGELLAERKAGKHIEVVQQQLNDVLAAVSPQQSNQLVLAYEPVWAIGTGETASAAQAQEMHAALRSGLAKLFTADIAANMSILYGGSCNAGNAEELFTCPDVDGGLIGGASLKADEFCSIINTFS